MSHYFITLKWLLISTMAILLSACGSSGSSSQLNNCTYTAHPELSGLSTIPDSVWQTDFQPAIDNELHPALQSQLEQVANTFLEKAPGMSVAVAIPGEGLWSRQKGKANTFNDFPVLENDLFQIASITKTFTAAIIMQLVTEKKLQLSDRISTWYPNIPNAEMMTIEHLLRHTSGLMSFDALPELDSAYHSADDIIALVATKTPLFCPGTQWAYSNTGYAILGRIIEIVEGIALDQVLEQRITRPLDLNHTLLRYLDDGIAVVDGHSDGIPVQAPDRYATPYAAGGMASNAEDLVKFWQALMAGGVVADNQLKSMYTLLHPMDQSGQMFYGMGVQSYDAIPGPGLMLGHSGSITGFSSMVSYIPQDHIYISVIFNDKEISAAAGLWSLVQTVRAYRSKN